MNQKIKISQLPAKGSNLAAADLLEIAEFTGTGYVSKSITGQEIIDAAAGSGVTDVTGTAPIASTGGTTPDISISQAGAATDGYLSTGDWNAFNNKQNALSSGVNIKTINSTSVLGSGNIAVQPTLVSGTNIKTINSNSLLGSGNVSVQDPITLTTTGTSGAATLVGSTLNIPQYSGGGSSPITNLGIGTTGTAVTGTTANTITQSVLIPANTLAANNTLDFIARFSKTGTAGGGNYRVYINTSISLTGATLFATLYQVAGGATIPTHQNQRTFFYDGTTLSSNAGGVSNVTDISQFTTAGYTMAYNSATAYYLIFAIQLTNTADSSVINGFRVLKYA